MNRILLASHGPLARGMKETLAFLTGENPRIECMCAYVDDNSRDVAKMIDAWDASREEGDWWIVVTDVYGGSVNNEFLRREASGSFALVAGMNLALLVELTMTLDSLDEVKLEAAVAASREATRICHISEAATEDEEDF